MRRVCAWCEAILEDGEGEITHTICNECKEDLLSKISTKGDEDELEKLVGISSATDGARQIYAKVAPEGGSDQEAKAGAEGAPASTEMTNIPTRSSVATDDSPSRFESERGEISGIAQNAERSR